MADFELSQYQKDIIDYFNNNPGKNMMIEAYAGCAKSYTILEMTKNTTTSDVYLAFNNAIAEEFRRKITNPKVKVYTLHSLGLAIMNYNLNPNNGGIGQTRAKDSKKVILDNLKIYKIVDDMVTTAYGRRFDWDERNFLKNNYVTLYNLTRLTCSVGDKDEIIKLVDNHGLFIDLENGFSAPDNSVICSWLWDIDKQSLELFEKEHVIDFTDMLYITVTKLQSKQWKNAPWFYFTNVYQDEQQDFSKLQYELTKYIQRKGGRHICVGDRHQCQPLGTKVQLIDGEIKNIEDLEFGDRVVQYSTERGDLMGVVSCGGIGNELVQKGAKRQSHSASFIGNSTKGNPKVAYTVIDKQEFYVDKLIKITTADGHSSSYTTNHKTYVKFNRKRTQEAVCLYLMERYDGLFRIGKVHMYSSQSTLGIKQRARAEGFDRCWILDIYDNNTQAWVNEQKYSMKYQIPQVIFQFEKITYTEEDVKEIYSGVIENMRSRAVALLEEFGRDINFPLWCKNNINSHTARDHCFVTEACNIIPNYMDALIFDETNRAIYKTGPKKGKIRQIVSKYDLITSVESIIGVQKVIGITTDNYHNYVADGVVTHNSIYNFAGADASAFDIASKIYSPIKKFDLPINYRCPASHLKYVNERFDIPIQARPNAPEGKIITIEKPEIINYVKPGDMIISRKNKWFAPLLLQLASRGIPIYIEDKEMVESIKKTIKAQKVTGCSGLQHKFEEVLKSFRERISALINKAQDSDIDINEASEKVNSINTKLDNINFTMSLLNPYMEKHGHATVDQFLTYLDRILNTVPSKDCVRICSVHKAKGLEAPNVFVLNQAKVCNDFRMSPEQREQEVNLAYISVTRAMENLYLVVEEDA